MNEPAPPTVHASTPEARGPESTMQTPLIDPTAAESARLDALAAFVQAERARRKADTERDRAMTAWRAAFDAHFGGAQTRDDLTAAVERLNVATIDAARCTRAAAAALEGLLAVCP